MATYWLQIANQHFVKPQSSPIRMRFVGDQMRPEKDPFALRWWCLKHKALSSWFDYVVDDPCWFICDARDPITFGLAGVGSNLLNACGVLMHSLMFDDQRTAQSDLKWWPNNFDTDFLVYFFFDHMIGHRINTVVMHVRKGFSNCLFFVKTHYYINKQLTVHGKVEHSIVGMKNEIICNHYVYKMI